MKKSSTGFSVSSYLFEIYPEISFHRRGAGKVQHFGCRNRPGVSFL